MEQLVLVKFVEEELKCGKWSYSDYISAVAFEEPFNALVLIHIREGLGNVQISVLRRVTLSQDL